MISDVRLDVAMIEPIDIPAADEVITITGHTISRFGLEQLPFS